MDISYPTLKKWIDSGRLSGSRKDPSKPKSPWQFTRENCIAALNYKMHNTQESVICAEEGDRKCQSSVEVSAGTQVTHSMVKGLRNRLAQRTKSKHRSCTIRERQSYGV
ncbi:Excisionase [Xenorhabdus bovienii str. kraussei Becker Underwood]|uniref:Excisionase n=1 Tax=Xenorhabdus bovienii str. kraussei Becker Underwood TaxID=1398204 RepID=A0A077PTL0_XENBV|nr:Excisionase [Xenorhabdus bovienii str. kraussei Becker Underwood]